jgi:RHS repeat-associated protein
VITYNYPGGYPEPGFPQYYYTGTINKPSSITRTVSGSTTQQWQYTYNSWGNVTQSIDPVGRTFTYTYDTNGIDLLEKQQTASSTADINGIWASYSLHLPGSYKDGSGQLTSYTYNSFGELATLTDPNSDVWTFTYDSNGYLTQIQGPLAGSNDVTNISYDGYGRVYQVTDSEGYTLTYSYDAYNRPTQTTYPDGTADSTIYDKRDAVLITDRLGRCTQRAYDSIGQLAYEVDPLGRKTRYKWCACGSLMSLTDPNGNKTSWEHDVEGRVIQKNYADQSSYSYTYDAVGRQSSRTDALGQTTNYAYNLDNTLNQVSYSGAINPTSTVTYSYDPYYVRLSSVANGWGTYSYSYNPYITNPTSTTTGAGQISQVTNSVIANSNITYSYDVLGRVTNRSINGSSNSSNWTYDAMSRITNETNPLGSFGYTYVDDAAGYSKGTTRLASISYPNGQITNFNWFGNQGDQRLQGILNLKSDGTCLSQFNYGYDSAGEITSWQQQQGLVNQQFFDLQYDKAGQLLVAKSGLWGTKSNPYQSEYIYSYDHGANRKGAQQWAAMQGAIGGTATPGDTVSLTVSDVGLPGGTETVSYTVQPGDDLIAIAAGLMAAVGSDTNLQAIGVSGTNFGSSNLYMNSISVNATSYSASTSGGATEIVTLALPHNNSQVNCTISGTITAGDVLTITVHDPALSGGQESVSYTVGSGDWTALIAYQLANAINSDSSLAANNIYAYQYQNYLAIYSNSSNVTTYTSSTNTNATEAMNFSINQNSAIFGSLAGTATPGDVLTVNVYDPALTGGTESASYTVQPGDSLASVATGITNAIAANGDIAGIVFAYTDGGSNITFSPSSINQTTYRATFNSGATETIVLGSTINSTGCSLGSSQYQYNNVNELVAVDSSGVTQFQGTTNKPVVSGSVVTNAMSITRAPLPSTTYGLPAYSSATETITLSPPLNGNVSATVGGTITGGDVLSFLVYNSTLPGGQEQVFYPVTSSDTLSTVATALAAAVNSDTNLAALGISASASSTVVSITQPSTNYSASTSSGATEWIFLHNNNNGNIVAEINGGAPITPGDTLTLTVTDPRISGGSESVTYPVVSTDNLTTIAGALAGLINGDTNLTNIGIRADYTAPAKFNWSESFTANQLTPFWNQSLMSATDAVPNTATAQYGIYTEGPNQSGLTYDLNGNMTSDGTNTYQWDAENRLVQINYPGTGNYSQFSYDGVARNVQTLEYSAGSLTLTKQFVWCGENRCEQRNASSSISAQFFALGEIISGTSYFYTTDHPGSTIIPFMQIKLIGGHPVPFNPVGPGGSTIREMTNSSGSIQAQYGYDPYGRSTLLQGSQAADFQFAGYYAHVRSGLDLALYRAYSPVLGRWISRDPIKEDGGINLYSYSDNQPVLAADILGLKPNFFREHHLWPCWPFKNPYGPTYPNGAPRWFPYRFPQNDFDWKRANPWSGIDPPYDPWAIPPGWPGNPVHDEPYVPLPYNFYPYGPIFQDPNYGIA